MADLPPLLLPPPLQKGDTIGVVASSYSPRPRWLARGVRALERAGYAVIVDPELSTARRYTRAEDERRAANFTSMWIDPRVNAVIGGTGGYGAVRMLPYLDPALFAQHPKVVRRLLRHHGAPPLADAPRRICAPSTAPRSTTSSPARATSRPRRSSPRSPRRAPPRASGATSRAACSPGRATGRLVGGNLSLVQQTIGTPYEIDTTDAILFLEEVRDPMSFVDERLVQLRAAGLLAKVRGIVFGQLSLDRSEEDEFEDFVLDLVVRSRRSRARWTFRPDTTILT